MPKGANNLEDALKFVAWTTSPAPQARAAEFISYGPPRKSAAALVGNTCQGCRVSISPMELAAIRKLPPEEVKRCENCRRILVVE